MAVGKVHTTPVSNRAADPPIPIDLWTRMARLDARCHIHLESVWGSTPGSLRWRVTIRKRAEPPDTPSIVLERASAVDALREGLDEAEARIFAH